MSDSINIIAVTAGIDLFKNERILNKACAKKYPGAMWIPILAEKLRSRNFIVTTADVALSHVRQGYWKVEKIGVVQHLDDPETEELIALGAKPIVLTVLESPLYVPVFYGKVSSIAPKFFHRVMFQGLFNLFKSENGVNYAVRFPSFSEEDLREIVSWGERKFMSMIVSNKYAVPFSTLYFRHPIDILKYLKRFLWPLKLNSRMKGLAAFNKLNGCELQDKRLSAIIFFGKKDCLRLYGKGWKNLRNLPMHYRNRLTPLFKKINPQYCGNKLETMREFKFALCFENYSFPGYFTEKIIECFAAGVIPVYLGAPDIEEFVPSDSFINVRKYQLWDGLLDRLKSFTDIEAGRMIDNGRKFLTTDEGRLHSFEGFASFIEGLISSTEGSGSYESRF